MEHRRRRRHGVSSHSPANPRCSSPLLTTHPIASTVSSCWATRRRQVSLSRIEAEEASQQLKSRHLFLDQISSELSDLIGADFDPSFVTWLFAELAHHYPDPAASSSAGPSSPPVQTDSNGPRFASRQGPPHQRQQDNRRLPAGPANMFGAALSGVKRDARDLDAGPQAQRARYDRPSAGFDGVPSGPRGQQQNGGGGVRGAAAARNGDRSILDRVGGAPAGSPAQFAPPAGFDPVSYGL